MAGQVVAVASGKGGVGKTTTVLNLGVVLRRAGYSVALVDADLGMANLGAMSGIDREVTLHDVLAGEASIDEAVAEEAPGFAVVVGSGSITDYSAANPGKMGELLEELSSDYDFVIVDTGAGMSYEDVLPLGLADEVILVASPDQAAIGDTRKTAELAELAEGDIAGLVVTKADKATDAEAVASTVGVELLGIVPYDKTVRTSTTKGRPLEAVDSETPAAKAYREIAGVLADSSADPLRETAAVDDDTTTGEAEQPPVSHDGPLQTWNEEGVEHADALGPPEAKRSPGEGVVGETEGSEVASEGSGESKQGVDVVDAADERDPFAEFEDDDAESTGGVMAWLRRLFR